MTRKVKYGLIAALAFLALIVGVFLIQQIQADREEQDRENFSGPQFDLVSSFSEKLSNGTYHFEVTIRNSGNEGDQAYFLCTLIYQNGDRDSDMFHMYVNAGGERTVDVYMPYADEYSHWVIETECTLQ